jgi:hypothetical protein
VVKLNNYLTDIRAQLPIYRDVRDSHVSTQIHRPRPRWK